MVNPSWTQPKLRPKLHPKLRPKLPFPIKFLLFALLLIQKQKSQSIADTKIQKISQKDIYGLCLIPVRLK